ncbi:MAG: 23S rRNA (uracil(1939)-C(5))-methyltransferase RlmD [Agathobacter sp.]|nr:23S rRNA (uracil(1939)-C(5))-methyltransferase RlmD [Agathobacter sp.]
MRKEQIREKGSVSTSGCPYHKKCGGCNYQGVPYEKQLEEKQKEMEKLLGAYGKVSPIVGMENPTHYRHKVNATFQCIKGGKIISGVYREGTHQVVDITSCAIEDEKADEVIQEIKSLLRSFRIRVYDEDTGYGLLRHVLIRKSFATGEMMVVLVLASPILPSKNNFVKALRKKFPEISTVVINVNDRKTSMVLGTRNITVYGKGYLTDELCGYRFRISPTAFYQINPKQTEKLYKKAIDCAALTGKETVIDAYCGTGTIGIIASGKAGNVIGVELNKEAVQDAVGNAKGNGVKNIRFFQEDAGDFMVRMASKGEKADVVIMDPPRTGSTETFLKSVVTLGPEKVVYVSCGPDTLARDLKYLTKRGYHVEEITPFDLFPFTKHVECVVLMTRKEL